MSAFNEAVALIDRITELEAEVSKLKTALSWIATVNACDYEYQDVAHVALDEEK